ncbi:hypothetical protein JYT76_03235 [Olleya sp. AH-315-F22]|nr:hypothetical protein [Olleya sp. AH-315-F22]
MLLIYISFYSLKGFAQAPTNFTEDYFLFIDHEKQSPVLILEDSSMYVGYDFKETKINGLPKNIPLKDFKAVKLKGQTYIVDKGCGPVFKFESNSLNRIDKSFRHRNQFNATVFVYNDKIHFFGGYGMFTTKNIVTYFDETTGEWLELPIKSYNKPQPRSSSNSILIDNKLYIWNGSVKDDTIFTKDIDDESIRVLDLKDNSWQILVKTKKLISINRNFNFTFQGDDVLYALSKDAFYKIDILKNQVTQYEFSMPNVLSCVYDPYTDNVILINKNTSNNAKNIYIKKLEELTKIVVTQKALYSSNNLKYIFWGLGSVILLLVLIILRQTIFVKFKKAKSIIYNKRNNTFTYKQKTIIFEKEQHLLFVFLINNQGKFILLDKINALFTSEDNQESYITINKRRDIAVKELVFKLKILLNKERNEILIERKNDKDKRIKEIKLGIFVQVMG